ncbi:MAG: hypothetical protein KFKLKKLM_01236 [Flavobacteriales bacterium]|nr:hypothetical protein [Flavobacteriales bacterium]
MVFKNIYITNSGIALNRFLLIKNSVFNNVPIHSFYKYALYKKLTERKEIIVLKNPIIIFNHWSSGFHHWVTESLVRLLSVQSISYDLILPENYPSFAFESLETFKFNSIYKLPSKTGAILSSVTIPPNPPSGIYEKQNLIKLKMHLFSAYYVTPNPIKNIYITRKNASKRKIENEDEIIPMLKQYNFEIIDSSLLTFQQQVELFSQCKILISIHGAGLTNVLFMDKQTQLIEFYKKNTFINPCYENMCEALEINFQRILCLGGKNNKTHVNLTDLVVNKNELELLLKNIIK